jgi:hypothetical protein
MTFWARTGSFAVCDRRKSLFQPSQKWKSQTFEIITKILASTLRSTAFQVTVGNMFESQVVEQKILTFDSIRWRDNRHL